MKGLLAARKRWVGRRAGRARDPRPVVPTDSEHCAAARNLGPPTRLGMGPPKVTPARYSLPPSGSSVAKAASAPRRTSGAGSANICCSIGIAGRAATPRLARRPAAFTRTPGSSSSRASRRVGRACTRLFSRTLSTSSTCQRTPGSESSIAAISAWTSASGRTLTEDGPFPGVTHSLSDGCNIPKLRPATNCAMAPAARAAR